MLELSLSGVGIYTTSLVRHKDKDWGRHTEESLWIFSRGFHLPTHSGLERLQHKKKVTKDLSMDSLPLGHVIFEMLKQKIHAWRLFEQIKFLKLLEFISESDVFLLNVSPEHNI